MDKNNIKKFKKKLEEEKDSLKKELGSFATKDNKIKYDWDARYPNHPDGADLEEEANETEEYDNLLSLEHSIELRLKDVEVALKKIKSGKYSRCENCGEEIEEKRLSIYPEAKLCVSCNRKKLL